MNNSIITKEYIDENIRPFTPNNGLFEACLFEVIDIDIRRLLGCSVASELLNSDETNPLSDNLISALDEGLRRGIGYLIYSRALRTATSTITKYGATNKNSDYSNQTDQQKIMSDSEYYKEVGFSIVKRYSYLNIEENCCKEKHSGSGWYNSKVIGD